MTATTIQGGSTSVDAKPDMIDVPVLAAECAAQLPAREIDVDPYADRTGDDDCAGEYAGLADSATELSPLVVREDPTSHSARGALKAASFATANRDWARAFPSLVQDARARPLRIVELGAGVGAVGLGLAQILPTAQVVLADLALPLLCEYASAAYPVAEPTAASTTLGTQGHMVVQHLSFYDYLPPTSAPRTPKQFNDRAPPLSTLVFHPTATRSVRRFVPGERPVDLIVFSDLILWAPLHAPLVATLVATLCSLTAAHPHAYIAFAYERRDFEKEVPFFRAVDVDHFFFNVPDAELHPQWQPDLVKVGTINQPEA
ncbi:hypothetical protein AMAG_18280 [Allomyces macrogynus ATCC 38327]|uniref:Uncharacterized protein n=1 Tax=Allomyces macrogynus (strain ATCC 38327) TaxID=578462 RepID=A0A0L0S7Z2_ALLM3|nr:hypothetical protein AMAG_18280 [Allomyces macrogynus ATCC 38327]|eukprot:KNE58617.1 hypothetical protein AMAG_18280 [Allomyces macrogynus ATCC 38327]